jgi:hypothetical protein
MGLTAMAFGSNNSPFATEHTVIYNGESNADSFPRSQEQTADPHVEITQPWEHVKSAPGMESKVQVKKSCSFFGETSTYIVAHILSGSVRKGMQVLVNGRSCQILELQAKLNAPEGVTGMDVGLTLEGCTPAELRKDAELVFFE